jgi:hypothetical protein
VVVVEWTLLLETVVAAAVRLLAERKEMVPQIKVLMAAMIVAEVILAAAAAVRALSVEMPVAPLVVLVVLVLLFQ